MSDIVLLDTSIYLNVLNVPQFNQDRKMILSEFEKRIKNRSHFFLPLVTILETGNNISRLENGELRWKFANILVEDVKNAVHGKSPYRPTFFPDNGLFLAWLEAFPELAKRNKSQRKTNEGVSLTDVSIIKEWEQTCSRHSMSSVLIWSLDCDLKCYHQKATKR